MENSKSYCVETQMQIRKPASQVFNAFIDPNLTKEFWFTKGSDKLVVGKTVTWTWEMYNHSAQVLVKDIIENEKITIEWGEPLTTVIFEFKSLLDGTTYVTIKEFGYDKTGNELLDTVKDATGGFTTVLDGLKAFMEHGINLNLIADKFPKEVSQH
jgi:uncharacterized protein YndB with AHSA1/START domain